MTTVFEPERWYRIWCEVWGLTDMPDFEDLPYTERETWYKFAEIAQRVLREDQS